ncbi:DUF6282 family protein [Devosia faecipullorum]|uniref:DUF6282 family protein n=1 Tax=Devosia faecipullorum TaxID=2755039 RepID=UPI00187B8F35|nr:DUF6282 family protein [Devosia faecipullorum]MBE7734274.1 hypothetical protein [Devosia faecipullorum]
MTFDLSNNALIPLVAGSIDLHGRSVAPKGNSKDLLDIARDASEAGLAAITFMDPHFSPTPLVETLKRHECADTKTRLLSGIELNICVGGLNVYAAEHELMIGGRIVSMPTTSAANYFRQIGRRSLDRQNAVRHPALEVLDPFGEPLDAVKEILDIIAAHDAVLATGFLHTSEIGPLLHAASQRGVSRMLITHSGIDVGMSMSDMRDFAALGAFVEHCPDAGIDCLGDYAPFEHSRAFISAISIDRTILVPRQSRTDEDGIFGRMATTIRCGLDLGYSPEEIRQMVSTNAGRLLGLPTRDR